jgi:hypothetical protein
MSQVLGGSVDTTSTTSTTTRTHQPNENQNDQNTPSTNITPSDDVASRKRQQSFISSTSAEDERQVGQQRVDAGNIPNQTMMSRFLETTPDSSPTHSGLGNDVDIYNQETATSTNITPTEELSARKRQRMTANCATSTVVHQSLQQQQQHRAAYTPPNEDFCELLNLVDKLREENDLLSIKCSTYEAENKTLKEQNANHVQTRR